MRLKKKIYSLVFADEFNSDTLNTDAWLCFNYSDEEAIRSDSQLSMNGEAMVITAENKGGDDYGFVMRTKQLFSRGYFEARMKLSPVAKVHSTFWINGFLNREDSEDISNEVDIFETFGNTDDKGNIVGQGIVHCWKNGANGADEKVEGPSGITTTVPMDNEYHVFALEWTEERLKFYIDGKLFREDILTSHAAFEPLLNGEPVAVFVSAFSSGLDDGESVTVETDYVRVYQ